MSYCPVCGNFGDPDDETFHLTCPKDDKLFRELQQKMRGGASGGWLHHHQDGSVTGGVIAIKLTNLITRK